MMYKLLVILKFLAFWKLKIRKKRHAGAKWSHKYVGMCTGFLMPRVEVGWDFEICFSLCSLLPS